MTNRQGKEGDYRLPKKVKGRVFMNCTPKVGQYDMLEITLGVYFYAKRETVYREV
jgi:hypothetical protein